ncbi:hypothetical protein RhiirA1_465053 [Rhizophagus irregularis]|uniref:Uncharacterized protein n=2 Tax=Rhizophagus irregularis TaxID=588596 RepID=A0A2N0RGT9_9GLOM|nr:hypothetical protein GLOIN_2v1770955 [Rhizophagus irregularis DAOM 181602=DAOM 197198]PKC62509.1 hypothetical protein RhiirA1_465053 [Rhizophagus irregularis]POG74705.1 hypothetical protein GLOIN_2v1770955 [Rhizophagus irregularis DAOM 181602=DAOM 197198]GET61651.1 hypothetical protein GLOIN_2v1770955 [Rhizophagus irregularis DAOM 181602=DAOM 197198]|eukprot:XP_025181571.1 hypothetical protein GLOIN_2v1770955 [Rhizophagus irregularis DAOM 181602=DAOM 197198]
MEAMKKELYEEYLNLEVIGIIWNNILVDEFDLKWNDINNGQEFSDSEVRKERTNIIQEKLRDDQLDDGLEGTVSDSNVSRHKII